MTWVASIGRGAACALAALLLVASLPAHGPLEAAPDGEPRLVQVPDVRRLDATRARRMLESVGLQLGEVYEVSRERILATWKRRFLVGYVFMQRPGPGANWPTNRPVDVILCAEQDGKLPPGLDAPAEPVPTPSPPDAPPVQPEPEPAPAPPTPHAPAPGAPPSSTPLPAPEQPKPPTPPEAAVPAPPLVAPPSSAPPAGGDLGTASGSPDAPRPAPPADPSRVPSLAGLELAEAEQLVRDAQMTLYVERVPGHPVGRVLEQNPPAGSPRPAGAVIKVVVTAGGDFAAQVPQAPDVYVAEIEVPDLLDRTPLQAGRILGALGLLMKQEEARRGLAGLVVDQKPGAGERAPRGGIVQVWIGPPDPSAPKPPPVGPTPPPRAPEDTPGPTPPPAPDAPPPPGPLPGGVPAPLAPTYGTRLPKDEVVPVGFTWRGVKGAVAYIVEIEEEGAEGRWIANVRKPVRTTAAVIEVERLGTHPSGRLRWRVRAVIRGREGTPSQWILLN